MSATKLLPSAKLATVHSILGVSLTMAVVCVRAAIRLDGRRAHELRLLAAMAQANGGCDAVLLVEGSVGWSHPLVVYGSRTKGASTGRYTVLPSTQMGGARMLL